MSGSPGAPGARAVAGAVRAVVEPVRRVQLHDHLALSPRMHHFVGFFGSFGNKNLFSSSALLWAPPILGMHWKKHLFPPVSRLLGGLVV